MKITKVRVIASLCILALGCLVVVAAIIPYRFEGKQYPANAILSCQLGDYTYTRQIYYKDGVSVPRISGAGVCTITSLTTN